MNIRAASVFFAFTFAFISPPAHAQDHERGDRPGETDRREHSIIQALASDVAALEARVGKLEGNISSADLVGTYAIAGITTRLEALIPGAPFPLRNAEIGSAVVTGTLTLNADGSGLFTITTGTGSFLTQGPWTLTPSSLGNAPGSGNITWTYASGTVTVSFSDGSSFNANVGPGGRLLVVAASDFNAENQRAETDLAIFTRLQ